MQVVAHCGATYLKNDLQVLAGRIKFLIRRSRLLNADSCSSFFKFRLDIVGFVLCALLFECFWCFVNETFGFLEAKTSDFTYSLDHCDFLFTSSFKDDVELCLFVTATATTCTHHRNTYTPAQFAPAILRLCRDVFRAGMCSGANGSWCASRWVVFGGARVD